MKYRLVLLLLLVGAVLISATTGTIAVYTVSDTFGMSVSPDIERILAAGPAVPTPEAELMEQEETRESPADSGAAPAEAGESPAASGTDPAEQEEPSPSPQAEPEGPEKTEEPSPPPGPSLDPTVSE